MKRIEKKIADTINIPVSMVFDALRNSKELVKHLKIPKKDGSSRTVYHPSKKLKLIQYWLIDNLFNNLPIHDASMAYRENKSIRNNVLRHRNNKYFLKLDFENFFPSIKFLDFEPIIAKYIGTNQVYREYNLNNILEVIRKACFYKNDTLAIGYPSSPIISNVILYGFDEIMTTYLHDKEKFGKHPIYTRYADDLTFSTNILGACNIILNKVKDVLKEIEKPDLKLNNKKTKFSSARGGSAYITGLRICHDKHITIHRSYKNYIRLLFFQYKNNYLSVEKQRSLLGHLSYIKYVDSAFYTKLQHKYYRQIVQLKSNNIVE